MMAERGVFGDHAPVHLWAIKVLPILAALFRRHKRPVGSNWRMDETYIKVSGEWKYSYRAVDRDGDTIDFKLCAHRYCAAARRFFEPAIDLHGVPEKITIDKSGADTAAIKSIRADSGADIWLPQSKYLSNIVQRDHRAIKRIVRQTIGLKSFRCAQIILTGIETMHTIKKRQFGCLKAQAPSAASQFYSLTF